MNKKRYIKWYRIARDIVKNDTLIPDRTDEEIEDLVSQEDWLMFAPKGATREQAKETDNPNIWFTIDKEDRKKSARIGLTFDNVRSVDRIKNVLSGYCEKEKEKLIEKLLSLEGVWKIKVKRKIKEKAWAETPAYKEEYVKDSNQIDNKVIDEVIKTSNHIREEGRLKSKELKIKEKFYRETPAIELMECEFELNEQEFKKRIKDAFEILAVCLNVKTDSEIKQIEKEKKKGEKFNKEIREIEESLDAF